MKKKITVGSQYGKLKPLSYDSKEAKWLCECLCGCGTNQMTPTHALLSGRRSGCREWERKIKAEKRRMIDVRLLAGITPVIAYKIIARYKEHLALCRKHEIEAESFRSFVRELCDDPNLIEQEAPVQSFDYSKRTFAVYNRPAEVGLQ